MTPESGQKLLLSLAFLLIIWVFQKSARWLAGVVVRTTDQKGLQTRFWVRRAVSLFSAAVLILGLLSIWFSDPTRLATAPGLVSAGLAFALQQPVTSIVGYFVILRGATFNVGDRISMGGARGDVLRLGFIQTIIMEMGQPPSVQGADPAMWVKNRQFTGRIVTVSNSKIFSEPIFNYTRDFPFLWKEMAIPITYEADRAKVEAILLDAAHRFAGKADVITADAKNDLIDQFGVDPIDLEPKVFFRITDKLLEMTVRFITTTHRIRGTKDAMSRHVLVALDDAGIRIASATYDIGGLRKIEIADRSAV